MHTKCLLRSQRSAHAANVTGINPLVQSLSCTPSVPRNTPLVSFSALCGWWLGSRAEVFREMLSEEAWAGRSSCPFWMAWSLERRAGHSPFLMPCEDQLPERPCTQMASGQLRYPPISDTIASPPFSDGRGLHTWLPAKHRSSLHIGFWPLTHSFLR